MHTSSGFVSQYEAPAGEKWSGTQKWVVLALRLPLGYELDG